MRRRRRRRRRHVLLQEASTLKEKGNALFFQKHYTEAGVKYTQALAMLAEHLTSPAFPSGEADFADESWRAEAETDSKGAPAMVSKSMRTTRDAVRLCLRGLGRAEAGSELAESAVQSGTRRSHGPRLLFPVL